MDTKYELESDDPFDGMTREEIDAWADRAHGRIGELIAAEESKAAREPFIYKPYRPDMRTVMTIAFTIGFTVIIIAVLAIIISLYIVKG